MLQGRDLHPDLFRFPFLDFIRIHRFLGVPLGVLLLKCDPALIPDGHFKCDAREIFPCHRKGQNGPVNFRQ